MSNKINTMAALFSSIFYIFNAVALAGWTSVLYALITQDYECSFLPSENVTMLPLLMFLEGICIMEVMRILFGALAGNRTLGVVLHFIRITNVVFVLPRSKYCGGGGDADDESDDNNGWLSIDTLALMVLYSWAITEVSRYPMYLFSTASSSSSPSKEPSFLSKAARFVRMTVPLVTFPLGAFAEAYAAYLTLFVVEDGQETNSDGSTTTMSWENQLFLRNSLLMAVVFINGILGPTMAYPALLKKGIPVLLGRKQQAKSGDKKKADKKFV
mmetsp:Transcript_6917/g.8975  ORF Transcript_6917/g.8975 Transcript_6917/m.8975 type:complete len:271 (+) Transcript_6917:15-827(+)